MSDTEVTPVSPDHSHEPGVIAGPDLAELDRINTTLARGQAFAGGLPWRGNVHLIGTLLAIARGPYGGASSLALNALRDAAREVDRAAG